jgi:hypothetical protein
MVETSYRSANMLSAQLSGQTERINYQTHKPLQAVFSKILGVSIGTFSGVFRSGLFGSLLGHFIDFSLNLKKSYEKVDMVTGVGYQPYRTLRNIVNIQSIRVVFLSLLSLLILQAGEAQAYYSLISTTALATPGFQTRVIAQEKIGDCACGPCAIFNAFQYGNAPLNTLASALPGDSSADKIRSLIALYGGKPSARSRNQPRYQADAGMWEDDVAPFINDWLANTTHAAPVTGERVTIQHNETPAEHLRRVYGELSHSLAAGFPPIVNLQSYAVRKNFFHHYWKWMDGHFVTVVAVQNSLPADASKFSMWVADSQTGRVLQVFVNGGADQSSQASTRSAGRSGKAPAAGDNPYLQIQSPKLEDILEGSSAQSGRTICVLQYMAHR